MKKAKQTADVSPAPRIVAGTGIAVGSDVSNTARKERKQLLEAALHDAVMNAIAASDKAGTGFPPDAVLRQAQADALAKFKQEHG